MPRFRRWGHTKRTSSCRRRGKQGRKERKTQQRDSTEQTERGKQNSKTTRKESNQVTHKGVSSAARVCRATGGRQPALLAQPTRGAQAILLTRAILSEFCVAATHGGRAGGDGSVRDCWSADATTEGDKRLGGTTTEERRLRQSQGQVKVHDARCARRPRTPCQRFTTACCERACLPWGGCSL